MVLHLGEEHFVAGAQVLPTEGLGHKIDRLGGAPHENDFVLVLGVHKALRRPACALVGLRRKHREVMHTAMHIGVVVLEALALGIHRHSWLLRTGRAVEVNQRLVIDMLREDGELGADPLHVERLDRWRSRFLARTHGSLRHIASLTTSADVRRENISFSTSARTDSTLIVSTNSLANAHVSRLRAASKLMPRERR